MPIPSPRLLLQANGNFADGLNAWFDDRVGFRDLFIRTKNQIDYSLFATSRKVYVGKDGWLFDRDPVDPLAELTPAKMTALKQSFLTLAEMLARRGICPGRRRTPGQGEDLSGNGAARHAASSA